MIHGKSLEAWCASHPLIRDLIALRETNWFNPAIAPAASALADVGLGADDVAEASARLQRFAPYIAKVFPETAAAGGIGAATGGAGRASQSGRSWGRFSSHSWW